MAVYTGSDYLRNGATHWIEGWKRRGWKTQEGAPVSNRDLWQRLEAAMSARRVAWPAVKGRDLPEMKELGKVAKEELRGGGSVEPPPIMHASSGADAAKLVVVRRAVAGDETGVILGGTVALGVAAATGILRTRRPPQLRRISAAMVSRCSLSFERFFIACLLGEPPVK